MRPDKEFLGCELEIQEPKSRPRGVVFVGSEHEKQDFRTRCV